MPIVRDTTISFELEPPSVEEMTSRVQTKLREGRFPFLVVERDGQLAGYAYAGAWRERAAYQWVVEVAIYISPAAQRLGLATQLYARLFELLRLQGFTQAMAVISLPNEKSVAFHAALGFETRGLFARVGFKHGRWIDVQFMQLELSGNVGNSSTSTIPTAPLPLAEALNRSTEKSDA